MAHSLSRFLLCCLTILAPVTLKGQSCFLRGYNSYITANAVPVQDFALVEVSGSNCPWSVSSNQPWLTFEGPTSGVLTNNFIYVPLVIQNNTSGLPRVANIQITVAGQTTGTFGPTITPVHQNPNSCSYSISPPSLSFGSAEQTNNVTVSSTPSGCWLAGYGPQWIYAQGAAADYTGATPSSVIVRASENTGAARSGAINYVGANFSQNVPVSQAAAGSSCTGSVSGFSPYFFANGTGLVNPSQLQFSVNAGSSCNWSVSTAAQWLTIGGAGSGTATSSFNVSYSASGNTSTQPRQATLNYTLGSQSGSFTVYQNSSNCTFSIAPPTINFAASGGQSSISVTGSPAGCFAEPIWGIFNPRWMDFTQFSGPTLVPYTAVVTAQANSGAARTANVPFYASSTPQYLVLNQASTCSPSFSPQSQSFGAGSGSGSFQLANGINCGNSPVSNAGWITINSYPANGTGNVTFSIAANPTGSIRTGTITGGGQTFTITQAAAGGVLVTSNVSSAIIRVDGVNTAVPQTFFWPAGSQHTLEAPAIINDGEPRRQLFSAWNGTNTSRTITVTANSGDTHTASYMSQSRLTMTAGSGGTVSPATGYQNDNTSVTITATPNPGAVFTRWSGTGSGSYSGTNNPASVSIAGPIEQTAIFATTLCSPALSPSSVSFDANANTGSVVLTIGAACPWTAAVVGDNPWLRLTGATSGTGGGSISFSVEANSNGLGRTATMSIGGTSFAVNQAGRGCNAGLNPAQKSYTSAGAVDSVIVTLNTGCPWSASTNGTPWVAITSVSSITGSGSVNLRIDANPAANGRSATLTIAGQPFTVRQAGGPCTYTLSELSRFFPASGGSAEVAVSAPTGCSYSASSAFATISSPTPQTGSSVVIYQVPPNPGTAPRTGTLTIAGQIVQLAQAAATTPAIGCQVATVSTPAAVRSTGHTELLSDLEFNCSGRSGSRVITADVLVTLNVNITNRLTDGDTVDAKIELTGGGSIAGRVEGPNSVRFPNVPLAAGEAEIARSFKIIGLRGDAGLLGATSATAGLAVTANVSMLSAFPVSVANATQPVGTSRTPLSVDRGAIRDGASSSQKVLPVIVQEAFPGAFKTRSGEAGVTPADTATRVRLRFTNIPATVQIFVPVASVNNNAQLISANANGIGGSAVVGSPRGSGNYGQVSVVNGTGYAVWEINSASGTVIDGAELLILVENAQPNDLEQLRLEAALAPIEDVVVASATAAIPRFLDSLQPLQPVDLRISGSVGRVVAGSRTTFQFQLSNNSDRPANAVIFRDTLPALFTDIRCTTNPTANCVVAGQSVRATFATLAAGAQASVTLDAFVGSAGQADAPRDNGAGGLSGCPNCANGTSLGNIATVSGNDVDPEPGNNSVPTPVQIEAPCQFALSRSIFTVSGSGGEIRADLFTGPGCSWSVPAAVNGIGVSPSGPIVGPATLRLTVPGNTIAQSRTLTVPFQTVTITIDQAGLGCNATLSTPARITSAGGPLQVQVQSTCAWRAVGGPDWLQLTSDRGTGNGVVTMTAQPNPSILVRSGFVEIAGQTVVITQDAFNAVGTVTSGLRFVAMEPCRLMETRTEYNFQGRSGAFGPPYLRGGETRTLTLGQSTVCQVPATAKAVVLNATLVPRGPADFITVWPGGQARPTFWTLRSPDGQTVANSAIVEVAGGGIQVYSSNDADLLLDISGYYTDNAQVSNQAFFPLTPCRVIDTRIEYRAPAGPFGPPSMNARETRRFRFPATPYCQIPAGASAYSVTVTAVPQGPLQFLTAWPAGASQPNVSNINSPSGRVLANSVIIPASADGSIDVFTFDRSDLLIDINGYFAPDNGLGLFYFPVTQCRISDSRNAVGTYGGPAYQGGVTRTVPIAGSSCPGIAASAQAFALNVTALPGGSPLPFITAWPTGQGRPNASILNAFQGQIVTNLAIVPAGQNGAIDLFPSATGNVVVEISGYFGR